ncbi:MAG: glycoside hydrolase family 10 protein [Bacteroidia bacterium]
MRLTFIAAILALCCLAPREPMASPKHEFRGVWVATFANLDWPSAKGLSVAAQKAEYIELLDRIEATGFNAIFVQVRPSGDALYESSYEPWSEFLTGTQGQHPGYDPLPFLIEEAHKRGLEFHAWLNPFRAVSHTRFREIASDHISLRYPDWFITHGTIKYFNPGVPAVRDYLSCVVLEVAEKYEVDGIHFDDYFYPYPLPKTTIDDQQSFKQYSAGDIEIANWRRKNINAFIYQVSDSLKKRARHVKFGVSPPAVWRNKHTDDLGSQTHARLTAYDNLYADSRHWLQSGWVDYLAPQCYHHHRFSEARYPALVDWWNAHTYGRHVYIGHAAYKVKEGRWPAWRRPEELPNQIAQTRQSEHIQGGIMYRAKSLYGNPRGFTKQLSNNIYADKALTPLMRWKDNQAPSAPHTLSLDGTSLRWSHNEHAMRFAVYRFPSGMFIDTDDPRFLEQITYTPSYSKADCEGGACIWGVTAIDLAGNESEAVMLEVGVLAK